MKPEERIETKLMIVIDKPLETAQDVVSIYTFLVFHRNTKFLKMAILESILFPLTYHLVARRLLFSFPGSWRI